MKKYTNPEIELIKIQSQDVILTSPGTETTPREEDNGIWELDITN